LVSLSWAAALLALLALLARLIAGFLCRLIALVGLIRLVHCNTPGRRQSTSIAFAVPATNE